MNRTERRHRARLNRFFSRRRAHATHMSLGPELPRSLRAKGKSPYLYARLRQEGKKHIADLS